MSSTEDIDNTDSLKRTTPATPGSTQDETPGEIVEDLESLKGLLDNTTPEFEVPLLDDQIAETDNVDPNRPGLADAKMSALLTDDWQDVAQQQHNAQPTAIDSAHMATISPDNKQDRGDPAGAIGTMTVDRLAIEEKITDIVDACLADFVANQLPQMRNQLVSALIHDALNAIPDNPAANNKQEASPDHG